MPSQWLLDKSLGYHCDRHCVLIYQRDPLLYSHLGRNQPLWPPNEPGTRSQLSSTPWVCAALPHLPEPPLPECAAGEPCLRARKCKQRRKQKTDSGLLSRLPFLIQGPLEHTPLKRFHQFHLSKLPSWRGTWDLIG